MNLGDELRDHIQRLATEKGKLNDLLNDIAEQRQELQINFDKASKRKEHILEALSEAQNLLRKLNENE